MEWLSNFGMREWLLSCGVVLVLVVLFDGFRRMRNEQKNTIKMSRRMGGGYPDTPIAEPFASELPNGGARVIGRDESAASELAARQAMPKEALAKDAIAKEVTATAAVARTAAEPAAQVGRAAVDEFHETLSDYTSADYTSVDNNTSADCEPPGQPIPASHNEQAESAFVSDQQILVLHAKSHSKQGFNGSDLLQVLLACDMRYGDRDILHRHERAGGNGSLQFSVANMVEPGTFNLEDINTFRTPGVSFFMTIPGPDEPAEAFECMLETANCVVNNLDAELLDENHDSATPKVLDELRERVKSVCISH